MQRQHLSLGAGRHVDLYTRDRRRILEPFAAWPVFQGWLTRTLRHFSVEQIEVQSVDFVGRGRKRRILFAKIKAHATDAEGRAVPGIVMLRGDVVQALVIGTLPNGDERLVKVVQPRLCISEPAHHEVVAGMCDDSDPVDKVVDEVLDETGLTIAREDVVDLTARAFPDSERGIACASGAVDALSRVYLVRVVLDEANLAALDGRHGAADENEHTRTALTTIADAWRTMPDALSLAALLLYEKLRDRLPA